MAGVDAKLGKKIAELVDLLRTEGVEIAAVYLYGSQVTGASHPDSDIDVAVISPTLSGERVTDWCRLNRLDVTLSRPLPARPVA